MRFKTVRATAFGCLKDQTLELAPGFTVIFGLNEAGKSTWHAATYAALCGVRRGSGVTAEEREFRARYMPWAGGRWDVSATVDLEGGGVVDLHHDLEGKVDCKAVDEMGRDVSSRLMFEGMPDGSTLLGLNRNLYPQVGCIRQADILGLLANPHELQERLQRVVTTSGGRVTVAKALENLRSFKSANIGLTRVNSSGPLANAGRALGETERRLQEARASHDQYSRLVNVAGRLRAEANQGKERRDQLDSHVLLAEAELLSEELSRMRELSARNPNAAPPASADEDALAARVAKTVSGWEERPVVAKLAGESAAAIQRRLGELPVAPTGDTAPYHSVVDAERTWRSAQAVIAAHVAAKAPPTVVTGSAQAAYELRAFAAALQLQDPPIPQELEREVALARQRMAQASNPGLRKRILIGLGAMLAVGGIVVAVLGFLPGLVALLAGVALASVGALARPETPLWQAIQEQNNAEASLAAAQADMNRDADARQRAKAAALNWGVLPEADALLAKAEEIDLSLRAAADASAWEVKRQEFEVAVKGQGQSLALALRERGAADSLDLESSLAAYGKACADRDSQLNRANGRPAVQSLLEARKAQEQVVSDNQKKAADAAEAILWTAGELRLPNQDPEGAAASLVKWQANRKMRQAVDDIARNEWQELQRLLADGSEGIREQRIDDLKLRAAAVNPSGAAPTVPAGSNPAALLTEARKLSEEIDSEASTEEGRCAQFARSMPSVSEAEESFEAAKEDLVQVRALEAVLDRTVEYLSAAQRDVQRDIAPVLSQLVEPRLSQLTGGRYARLTIDPANLEVSVVDSTGAHRPAGRLSHGTTEQVYLLLRVALAEVFGKSGESVPLLLDDVTVESDRVRTEAILLLLHELSTSHQIVLFTQEDDVLEWAKVNLRGPNDEWKILV